MEIIKLEGVTKCDMPSCRNTASYAVGGEGVMPRRRLNLCLACAVELYGQLGTLITPKSPKNHIQTAYENQTKNKMSLGTIRENELRYDKCEYDNATINRFNHGSTTDKKYDVSSVDIKCDKGNVLDKKHNANSDRSKQKNMFDKGCYVKSDCMKGNKNYIKGNKCSVSDKGQAANDEHCQGIVLDNGKGRKRNFGTLVTGGAYGR